MRGKQEGGREKEWIEVDDEEEEERRRVELMDMDLLRPHSAIHYQAEAFRVNYKKPEVFRRKLQEHPGRALYTSTGDAGPW